MGRISIPTLIIVLLLLAILLTFMSTHEVAFHEAAVKVRFGRPLATITEPGLKLRWPWPIEAIRTYDTRLRTLDAPETEVKTRDGQNLIIGTYAIWRIADPLLFSTTLETVAEAERQMRSRISQVQAAIVGQKSLADFVNLDRQLVDARYDGILRDMLDKVEQRDGKKVEIGVRPGLLRDYGIHLEEIGIRRISLPKEVTQKVFESMIQERKKEATRIREEGKARAAAITARAEGDAKQILEFAGRKAAEIRSAGIQASTRLLEQIQQTDPELFEWLRWLDALKASMKQRTTIFIDQTWPLFEPFVQPPVTPDAPDTQP